MCSTEPVTEEFVASLARAPLRTLYLILGDWHPDLAFVSVSYELKSTSYALACIPLPLQATTESVACVKSFYSETPCFEGKSVLFLHLTV